MVCYTRMLKLPGFIALIAVLGITLFGQAAKLDGLFLTMRRLGGSYSPTYYWFRPDGRVFGQAPEGGLTPSDFQTNCQKYPTVCGTYRQNGEMVEITMNGQTRQTKINSAPGGFQVDGMATIKAEPFAPGTRMNGKYSGSGPRAAVSTGAGNSVSSAHSYWFRPDGTFTRESVGAVRTSSGGAAATSGEAGTYRLDGNTLEMTERGQTTRHLAFVPYSGAIVIDGIICSERK